MTEQFHSGSGDNVGGDQTKIDRQTNMGDGSFYYENPTIIQSDQKIKRFLTAPPSIPSVFQGRETDLDEIRAKLIDQQTSQLLVLVNGEGGIGKTALAATYWQRYQKEYHHLAWLFCSGSLQDTLLTLELPLRLSFPETMPGEERLSWLLQKLTNLPEPCLLVLDNANDRDELKRHFLALQALPNCHVLLTSRINQFEHAEQFKIKPLLDADALNVFRAHYPKHTAEEDSLFHSIFTAVGGNTLVMEVLAKNLAVINADEMSYSLTDLLRDLQDKGLLHLSQTETVTITVKGQHAKLEDAKPNDILMALYSDLEMVVPLTDGEQYFLSNLSVLPAERLPYSMLKDLLVPEDRKLFSKTLTSLARRGWLERSEENGHALYKISPVVQEITRHKNQNRLIQDCLTLINKLIEKLKYEPGTGHLLNASYEEGALYDRLGEEVFSHLHAIESVYDLSRLADSMGYFQRTTGNLERAFKYFNQAYQIAQEFCRRNPGDSFYQDVLAIYTERLGSVAVSLGNLEQALRYYLDCNRLAKELYEAYPSHVEFKNHLAISNSKLGDTHTTLGNLDQALGYYQDYTRLENELHEAYPSNVAFKNGLAISYERLGDTHTKLGNLDQAFGYYLDYNRLEKELNEAYPSNVAFKNNLAISYSKLGDTHTTLGNLDQALGYFEERSRLGKELHEAYPSNAEFKNGLAVSYSKLGTIYEQLEDREKARDCYRLCQNIWQELSKQFPAYVEFSNNRAWVNNRLDTLNTDDT